MKQKNKSRKVGRNAASCLNYKNSNRREKNKIEQLEKHLKLFPNDEAAKAAIVACRSEISGH